MAPPPPSSGPAKRKETTSGSLSQDGVHGFPQGPGPFAVNNAHFQDALFTAGGQVFGDQFLLFPGVEGVQVQDTVDRQFNRLCIGHDLKAFRPGLFLNKGIVISFSLDNK